MYIQEIKIPKDRVGVLIGTDGKFKKRLEKKTKTKIDVDSETGFVEIKGEDSVTLYVLKDVVQAIGRGFSPEIAEKLLKEDTLLEIVNIQDFSGKSKKKMDRLRGRVIGTKGKGRTMVEQITNTKISVYGKTVAVVGRIEDVIIAKEAVESLLSGSPHGNIYRWLLDKKKKQTKREIEDGAIN
ncbi:MAG: KH domain-containing protein [Nanoarchaeota archaeon]|nr:KH domain-containing protein [Nanoarchaeota archaeon]